MDYYATATDIYGNNWDITTVATITTTGGGSFISQHKFVGTATGTYTIQVAYEDQIATTTVVINYATPTALSISPSGVVIIAGDSVDYHATATDQYGNNWAVTDAAIFTTTGGGSFISQHGFVGTIAGTHIIQSTYEGNIATTTVTINHATPTILNIFPINTVLIADLSIKYYATATDTYGNSWNITDTATITSTGGGDFSKNVFTGIKVGTYTITVEYMGLTATTSITIHNAIPTFLIISPDKAELIAGESMLYRLVAADSYGNSWDGTDIATFTTTGGGSFSLNRFTGITEGTYIVTGEYAGLLATTTITIKHAIAMFLSLAPVDDIITAGESVTYHATATDWYNNPWAVTDAASFTAISGGTFVSQHGFVGTVAGTHIIQATYKGITATTTITINHTTPISLNISPRDIAMTAGSSVDYHATATDQYGNTWDVTNEATITTSGTGGSFISQHRFVGTVTGTHTIQAIYGGQTATTTVTINHATPIALSIIPLDAVIIAGEKIDYHATATDIYGNKWDATDAASFTTTGGGSFISQHRFVGTIAGTHIIQSTYEGNTATTTVTINHTTSTSLSLDPGTITIIAGEKIEYHATATDQYGNTWNVTDEATITTNGGGMFVSHQVFKGMIAGTYSVYAEYKGNPAFATITVIHTNPSLLNLSPGSATIFSGESIFYYTVATDAYGNIWDVTGSSTFIAASGGRFNKNLFTGTASGTHIIRTVYEGVEGTASITIKSGLPILLNLFPEDMSITAGESIPYEVIATDVNGNRWGVTFVATFTTTGGSFNSNILTGITKGTHTIIASYMGLKTTARVTIDHAIPQSLSISPRDIIVIAGESVPYHATATDAYNNSWDITDSAIFTSTGDNVFNRNCFTAAKEPGVFTVFAQYQLIATFTTITISASPAGGNWLNLTTDCYTMSNGDRDSLDLGAIQDECITVEAWILPKGTNESYIVYDDAYDLSLCMDGNGQLGAKFRVYNPQGTPVSAVKYGLELNQWNFVTGIFDGNNNLVKVGINGKLSTVPCNIGLLYNGEKSFYLGVGQYKNNGFYGYIDEVRISDIVRYTEDFIPPVPLPQHPEYIFEPDERTRALWHFNESSGGTIFYDAAGKNNTLAAGNGACIIGADTNIPPVLGWTEELGYVDDGVAVDEAVRNATFTYRIKYTDINNHPPEIVLIYIGSNDGAQMSHATTGPQWHNNNNYEDGEIYEYTFNQFNTWDQPTYKFSATDGQEWTETEIQTGPIIINALPQAKNLSILPQQPILGDSLSGTYTFTDEIDGEFEQGSIINWYQNGNYIPEYDVQLTIPSIALRQGDVWYFTVMPGDGRGFGSVSVSPRVCVGNTKPVAISLDMSAGKVLRTKPIIITSHGTDTEDAEAALICEMEYRHESGTWTALEEAFVNNKWQATVTLTGTATLGSYTFRVRYTNTFGFASDWFISGTVSVENNPPVIGTACNNFQTLKNTRLEIPLYGYGSDIEDEASDLIWHVGELSVNTKLFTAVIVNGSLTITPILNQTGKDEITLILQDKDGGTDQKIDVMVKVLKPGSIIGRVTVENTFHPCFRIELKQQDKLVIATSTDSEGRYQLFGIPEGEYSIETSRQGFIPQIKGYRVLPGTQTVDFQLSTDYAYYQTIILINTQRMNYRYNEFRVSRLMKKLGELADCAGVNGIIQDVEQYAGIHNRYEEWDKNKTNSRYANKIVETIDGIVEDMAKRYSEIKYLVIVGDDDIIPYYRADDDVYHYKWIQGLGEHNYQNMVGSETGVGSAFWEKGENWWYESQYQTKPTIAANIPAPKILTDAIYEDMDNTEPFYSPDYSLGRLIETPEEIIQTIDTYLLSPQLQPEGIFVAGSDFAQDSASKINNILTDKYPEAQDSSLIGNEWTRDDLVGNLLSKKSDIICLNVHANHTLYGSPDNSGVWADEIGSSTADLSGVIVFSVGCHAGLVIGSNEYEIPQALISKGVTAYLGNTTFGIGNKEGLGWSEALNLYFATFLTEEGNSVGDAFNKARLKYIQENSALYADGKAIDKKVLLGANLYGLPMYKVASITGFPAPTLAPETPMIRVISEKDKEHIIVENLQYERYIGPDHTIYYSIPGKQPQTDVDKPLIPRLRGIIPIAAGREIGSITITDSAYHDIVLDESLAISNPCSSVYTHVGSFTTQEWYPKQTDMVRLEKITKTNGVVEYNLIILPGQCSLLNNAMRLYDRIEVDIHYLIPPIAQDRGLRQIKAYPNPFLVGQTPFCRITCLASPEVKGLSFRVYNIAGELVKTFEEIQTDGQERFVEWDGRNDSKEMVASGIYFYLIKCDQGIARGKIGVIK